MNDHDRSGEHPFGHLLGVALLGLAVASLVELVRQHSFPQDHHPASNTEFVAGAVYTACLLISALGARTRPESSFLFEALLFVLGGSDNPERARKRATAMAVAAGIGLAVEGFFWTQGMR